MTNKEIILTAHRSLGRADAKALREKAAAGATGTYIIEHENAVPFWNEKQDYTNFPIGTPVQYENQIFCLIQPHNAAYYPGSTPITLAALWRVKHTTNPKKAKPWVKPTSTSDMYLKGECMIWTDGVIKIAKRDTVYSPEEYSADWEDYIEEEN